MKRTIKRNPIVNRITFWYVPYELYIENYCHMKSKFLRFLTVLTAVMLPVFSIHFWFYDLLPGLYLENAIVETHLLMYILTVLSFGVLCIFAKKMNNYVGFAFLGFSIFKMLSTVLFLLPMLQNEELRSVDYVLQFFCVYFFYLILELWFVFRLLIRK